LAVKGYIHEKKIATRQRGNEPLRRTSRFLDVTSARLSKARRSSGDIFATNSAALGSEMNLTPRYVGTMRIHEARRPRVRRCINVSSLMVFISYTQA
jgi:hypothetical protein